MNALAISITAAFWVFGVAFPLGSVIGGIANRLELLLTPWVLHSLKITALQAAISAALSMLIGLALGVFAPPARSQRLLWSLPYGVPTVCAAMAFASWLSHTPWSYSLTAVIIAHVFLNAPWVALWVSRARDTIPENLSDAARTLGGGEKRFVVWPYVRWAWFSSGAHVFALCSMSFALILLLGSGPPVETLETSLYARVRSGGLDLAGASACALWELVLTLAPWLLVLVFQSRAEKLPTMLGQTAQRKPAWSWILLSAVICLAPYLPLVAALSSLRTSSLAEILQPLLLSLRLSLTSSMLTTALALAAVLAVRATHRYSKQLGALAGTVVSLSSSVSVLVVGLGFWIAYGGFIDPFEGSLAAMVAVQVVVFLPVAFKVLWPLTHSEQTRALEAARTLGATPLKSFWIVEEPRWRGPVCAVFGIACGTALGEVAAVSLFYSEKLVPLPLVITRLMGQYRFDEASGVAALLFVLSAGLIALFSIFKTETAHAA